MRDTPKDCTEEALLFIVPACKCQAALDLCHRDAGHQGRDRTYSLLKERFRWSKMHFQMMGTVLNCAKCKLFERRDPMPPLLNIVASEPMDVMMDPGKIGQH